MDWHFPRSVYSIGLMCSAAAEHGLSADACLEGSGITPAMLDDPATEVSAKQELVVVGNLVRRLSHVPGLGLEVGTRFHISVYGVLAFALSSCANLRELIELGLRYSRLAFSLTDKQFGEKNGEFYAVFEDTHIPEALRAFVVERDLAGLFNVMLELYSTRLPLRRVQVRTTRPAWADRYFALAGVEPEYGAAQNRVVLDAKLLDLRLPQANPQALRFWEAQLRELLARKQARTGVAGKVRAILSRRPGEAPDMEAVARELHTTSRQLRRLLTEENTSFRDLVDELRETLAEELLTGGRLTVEQVADRLGYNEVSSFSNAFKRWKGQAPTQWRDAQRAGDAVPVRTAA